MSLFHHSRFRQSRFDLALKYAGGWSPEIGKPDSGLGDKVWYLEATELSAAAARRCLVAAELSGDIATKNAAYWKADLWLRVCELAVTYAVEGVPKPDESKPDDSKPSNPIEGP